MGIDYSKIVSLLKGKTVDRPNKADAGTLSGHAAGEPFANKVYNELKLQYPAKISKQYEYLNDLYRKHPQCVSLEARKALFESPTVLFLVSRGKQATETWDQANPFSEKQNDTADIIFHDDDFFDLIDVKSHNSDKNAQPPNIISAYKVAQMCSIMLENEDFASFHIHYIGVEWAEDGDKLKCISSSYIDLFKVKPSSLYINWSAALQIQFHVQNLRQDFQGDIKEWCKEYLKHFVASAQQRCESMKAKFITPFLKYIE